MGLGYGWVESAFLRPKRLGPGVVVIREVRVGFGWVPAAVLLWVQIEVSLI